MNRSSWFGSGGVGSSEVLSERTCLPRKMAPLRGIRSNLVPDWSRHSEELADLPLATEAAGRDRVGLTLGSV